MWVWRAHAAKLRACYSWCRQKLLLAPKLLLLPPLLLLQPGLTSQMATLGLTQLMTTLGLTQQMATLDLTSQMATSGLTQLTTTLGLTSQLAILGLKEPRMHLTRCIRTHSRTHLICVWGSEQYVQPVKPITPTQ